MTRAARSLFAFGLYVIAAGVLFLIAPQLVVNLLHLPPVSDGWMRLIGVLSLVIGTYDLVGAAGNFSAGIQASVFARLAFAVATVVLVATRQMPPVLMLFGAVDALGACWTALAFRSPGQSGDVR